MKGGKESIANGIEFVISCVSVFKIAIAIGVLNLVVHTKYSAEIVFPFR